MIPAKVEKNHFSQKQKRKNAKQFIFQILCHNFFRNEFRYKHCFTKKKADTHPIKWPPTEVCAIHSNRVMATPSLLLFTITKF